MEHVVIIGNGISGITAARHIRKLSDKRITVISSESDYFFSRTALMYVYMGHMKFEHTQPYENNFWGKNNIKLVNDFVSSVDVGKRLLHLSKGAVMPFDKLIIATGSKSNKFGWPGQDLQGVSGLYSKQDLEYIEQNTSGVQQAVVVGGGLIGIELAEMLLSRNIKVTFLVREKNFWDIVLPLEESQLLNRHIAEHGIDLRLETELKEVIADNTGKVKSIITNTGEEINCQFVGLTVGVSPNIDFLKSSRIELGRGVKVNDFLETNIKGIYAIGDCAEQQQPTGRRRPIEAVWYTGRIMGETVAHTICNMPVAYKPGHWFNSAKFLDIEYQTYGWVFPKPGEQESHFYWESKCGKKAVRFAYNTGNREFIGVNSFGIRLRHNFFDKALTEKKDIDYVVTHLSEAAFDPEFFERHEAAIQLSFTNQFQSV